MSLEIRLNGISKRYGYQWIIRNCNHVFTKGSITGISGPNGSGKSTLIKIISSYLSPTEGTIEYFLNGEKLPGNQIYQHVGMVAPYTSLIHEFTLREQFDYHCHFKGMIGGLGFSAFQSLLQLETGKDKKIGEFSSGMHQRLQLALQLISESPLLLLDEPTSYLDSTAKAWMFNLLDQFKSNRTIIIASNDQHDFQQCEKIVDVKELKVVS